MLKFCAVECIYIYDFKTFCICCVIRLGKPAAKIGVPAQVQSICALWCVTALKMVIPRENHDRCEHNEDLQLYADCFDKCLHRIRHHPTRLSCHDVCTNLLLCPNRQYFV